MRTEKELEGVTLLGANGTIYPTGLRHSKTSLRTAIM